MPAEALKSTKQRRYQSHHAFVSDDWNPYSTPHQTSPTKTNVSNPLTIHAFSLVQALH